MPMANTLEWIFETGFPLHNDLMGLTVKLTHLSESNLSILVTVCDLNSCHHFSKINFNIS